MHNFPAIAPPYSVIPEAENGLFRVADSLGRPVIYVSSVRNIGGHVLPQHQWVEDGQRMEIAKAVAASLSSARDTLEALEQLLIEYDEVDLAAAEPPSFTAAVNAARAAIAKAREVQS